MKEYFKDKPNSTGLNKKQGEMLKSAIKSLENNEKIEAGMKKRIKKRGFTLNEQDELLCDGSPVVFMENYYDKINEVHSDMGHPVVQKSTAQINLQFSCIPRNVVEYHIKTCSICNLRRKQVIFLYLISDLSNNQLFPLHRPLSLG